VEILVYDASTKRSSNLTPFDKISKSGDGGGSGDILVIKEVMAEVRRSIKIIC
jgi:hypothetical protein